MQEEGQRKVDRFEQEDGFEIGMSEHFCAGQVSSRSGGEAMMAKCLRTGQMLDTSIARLMNVLCVEQEGGRTLCSRVECCVPRCDVMARCMECKRDAAGKNGRMSSTGQILRPSTSKTARTLQMRRRRRKRGRRRRGRRRRGIERMSKGSFGQRLLSFLVPGAPSGLGGRWTDDSFSSRASKQTHFPSLHAHTVLCTYH